MPVPADRVAAFGTTIFTEINLLAQQYNAVNLGQGKPDFAPPDAIVQQLVAATQSGLYHQYAPGPGTLALREGIADHAARFYGLTVDPAQGVVVTAGATEGIFSAILGLVDPSDEVIVIEPCYDSYVPNILMAGAVPVYVPLRAPNWTFDPAELAAAFSERTRAIILNTPHNPTGRVFSEAELAQIAELCQAHDVVVIADEVYDHLLFDHAQHVPMATLPGMFERTVTVGSAGKLFSVTGWKIGWVAGPPALIEGVARVHQFVTFAVHHPAQEAVAHALHFPDAYFADYQVMYARKRQILRDALDAVGLRYSAPEGAYYIMADYSTVFEGTPVAFARHLAREIGVTCIPPETFYGAAHAHLAQNYVRFAFCKEDAVLHEAGTRLMRLKNN